MSQVWTMALQTLVGKSTESDKDTVLKLVRLKGVARSALSAPGRAAGQNVLDSTPLPH